MYPNHDGQRQYRPATSTNPFDFPPSPPPPPVPPRPHAHAQAHLGSQHHTPSPPPHHYPQNDPGPTQLHRFYDPSASRYPTNHTASLPPPLHVPHRNGPIPSQTPRHHVPELTAFPTSYESAPNQPPTFSPHPPPPPPRHDIPAEDPPMYFNNPWADIDSQEETARLARGASLGVPSYSRTRAHSTAGLRPPARPHTTSTFVTPTMSFPVPQIPSMPNLGRATSANATVPISARQGALPPPPPLPPATAPSHGRTDHWDNDNHGNTDEISIKSTPATPSGGSNSRRPSSRSGGSARSEFRFSPNLIKLQHMPSVTSFQHTAASSSHGGADVYESDFLSPSTESLQLDSDDFAKELSNLTLDMDENIRRFQKGELPEADQEWNRLVPEEALKALEDNEIKRQGLIFELLKAEREYVVDLETMEDVFVKGLTEASPMIIPEAHLAGFVNNVFGNLRDILAHHQRMLSSLFERQRETHPLIHSIADIVLQTCLKPEFRNAYEIYIKNYPVSESFHQKELQSNPAYVNFLQSISKDPRIKKRDMKIFLSRPLTRLVRLNLLIEQIHKRTDKDHGHPDVETLPIIQGIVSDCIKATQPGIEAAEQKVKFWDLCENLILQKGEITEMDLYDKERHLVHMGSVWRRTRSETGFTSDKWMELTAYLLDNYFLLVRDTRFANGLMKKVIVARPIPLSFLRLTSFTAAAETRREKIEDGGILDTFRSQNITLYPFTPYHASLTLMKTHTIFVTSEPQRKKWNACFVDALGVHKARQEGNQWFSQGDLLDGFFRVPREAVTSPGAIPTGRVTSAVPFATANGQRYLAIGCASGIYVAPFNKPKEQKRVFTFSSPPYLAALQTVGDRVFNKFIIHADNKVFSYSLELIARYVTSNVDPRVLEASKENVTSPDQHILFVRHVLLGERVLLVYAAKKRLGNSVSIHAVEAIAMSIQRTAASAPSSFRQFGQPGYLPKEASDLQALSKTINVCVRGGLVSANPGDFPNTASSPVPVIHDSNQNAAQSLLKSKIDNAKSLGIVKSKPDEFMVIFEDIGCYMNSRGLPLRNYGFIKWETRAVSYAHRNGLILLISPRFIEIRAAASGGLVQVIEGTDIRLLYAEPEITPHDNILLAMRGRYNDISGVSEKIVELTKTVEINGPPAGTPLAWSEWDM